jgi:hypothetical protein
MKLQSRKPYCLGGKMVLKIHQGLSPASPAFLLGYLFDSKDADNVLLKRQPPSKLHSITSEKIVFFMDTTRTI